MENQALYDDLFTKVKDSLNYQEIQELISLQKENIPLLEKKLEKLKSGKVFVRIVMLSILTLMMLFSILLQANALPKLNQFILLFLMIIPVGLSNSIVGKNSLPALQNKIDNFELMLMLTKNG